MTTKGYLIVSGVFFFLIAVLHLLRLIYQLPILVENWSVPLWISVGGFIVPMALALFAFRSLNSMKKSE